MKHMGGEKDNMPGIAGYGVYIPKYRLKLSEIAEVWRKNADEIQNGLKVTEKAVPYFDEDSVTMAVAAGKRALSMTGIHASKIESVYFGSESHPYVVNPSSSIVAEYLGVGNDYFAADLEFACKAATAGMQVTIALLESQRTSFGLIIGSDTAQGKPHDALEYTAGSAAVAYVLGVKETENIANVLTMSSFTSDTPDFWRRDGQKYPSHFGRFTGGPAYFTHILTEGKKLLAASHTKPTDFDYCVFHMPNGKFPRIVAKKLGFTEKQLAPSLIIEKIGNPYSASVLLGLAAVFDIALPNQKIFFVSYGSGAGSDGFIFETTKAISKKRNKISVSSLIENKEYISYAQYLKQTHTI
jgi:hydroxymethylglutaryl-CoA synthase